MSKKMRKFFKRLGERLLWKFPVWVKYDGLEGHKPTITIRCPMCKKWWWPVGYKMVLRNSKLMVAKISDLKNIERNEKGEAFAKGEPVARGFINRLNYKCPRCELVVGFFHPCKEEYLIDIFKKRGKIDLYYPGIEEWSEDKLARQKLESLGYM